MDLTEKLIELVRKHPCLYDYRVKNYHNLPKKNKLWELIGQEMDQSAEAVKAKWKNIKDGYAKYQKTLKDGSPHGPKRPYENWMWGPYLTFLDGAVKPRGKVTLWSYSMNNSPESSSNLEVKVELEPEDIAPGDDTNDGFSGSELYKSSYEDGSHVSKKRRLSQDPVEKILEFIKTRDKVDSVDLLFASYAKTLKKLSPRSQASVKIKVAQIFADAELLDLSENNGDGNHPLN